MNPIGLKSLRPCDVCGNPVAGKTRDGHTLDFRRLVVERHFVDIRAIQEHAGLTLMLGSPELAMVVGSRANATIPLSATELVICNPCWYPLDALVNALEARKGCVLEEIDPERCGSAR